MNRIEVLTSFWRDIATLEMRLQCSGKPMSHNDFPVDVRVAFCEYVDALEKSGQISEDLARVITL